MHQPIILHYNIRPMWELIEEIQDKALSVFDSDDKQIITSTMQVITELLENAIKYGKPNSNLSGIDFNFTLTSSNITIQVTNAVISQEHLDKLTLYLDKIHRCIDPNKLYKERLEEIFKSNSPDGSRLGLIRIANESGYTLSHDYHNGLLTITAQLAINSEKDIKWKT